MKKIIPILLCAGYLLAQDIAPIMHENRSVAEKVDKDNKEKFIYNKGYSDGYGEGKEEGYKEALKEAKISLERYEAKMKQIATGYYLSKSGKITAPRVYQRSGNGKIEVVVEGCRIERALTAEDLICISGDAGCNNNSLNSSPRKNSHKSIYTTKDKISNGVFLAGVDRYESTPTLDENLKEVTFLYFADTAFYRDVLMKANVPFSYQSGGKIKARFSSQEESDRFAQRYGLVAEKDYK